jgi:hypothetical protein
MQCDSERSTVEQVELLPKEGVKLSRSQGREGAFSQLSSVIFSLPSRAFLV